MPYRSHLVGHLFFVRWSRPEVDDVDMLAVECIAARGKAQRPLTTISIVPEDSETPGSAFRKRVVDDWDRMVPAGELVHAVIEGNGLRATLHRTILRALKLVLGRRRNLGAIHNSIEDCLRVLRLSDPRLVDELRAKGILGARGLREPAEILK